MKAHFVPTTQDHILHVAERMRKSDIDEVWAASHHSPQESLNIGVAESEAPLTMIISGEPACITGICSIGPGIGAPWMLGTELIEHRQIAFLRACVPWLEAARRDWGFLVNFSDARADRTHRWLIWLGFEVMEPEPFGVERMPFRRFQMITK